MVKPNGKIKIEKGIPVPKMRHGAKYPWLDFEVGDSFLIPNATESQRCGLSANARRFGIRITTRKVAGGIRVWRIAEEEPR